MKQKILSFVFLIAGLMALTNPLFGQSQSTGLLPTPYGLQQATRQAVMSSLNLQGEELPYRVDLAEGRIVARSQGHIGSCGSFSVAQSLSLMRRINENLPVSNRSWHSPSFLYNQVMIGNDFGSTYYDNLELAKNFGIATMITFPYTMDTRQQPGTNAFREAQQFRISEWRRIQHDDISTFRSFLAQGYPIMITLKTYENIFSYQGGVYYPAGDLSGTYHAVLVTGYDDAARVFTALNSWGNTWGDGRGFFKFSYETLENSSLVLEAYIMVPAARDQRTLQFPAGVEASRGSYNDRIIIKWQPAANALEYEVFRLDSMQTINLEEEQYISLGITSSTSFVDFNIRQDHSYFYFVRTHTSNASSDLSFPVEGWSSAFINGPPGIPLCFSAVQQGSTVVCMWDSVENADRYIIYAWRNSDWFKLGETTLTSFTDARPVREGNSPISYMVIAENRFGQSLPSNSYSVLFDGDSNDHDSNERYRGDFYTFPMNRFIQAEQAFLANFQRQVMRFEERFRENQHNLFRFFGGR